MQPSIDEVIGLARMFRNIIIEGPPGTGKTRLVGEVVARWTAVTGREVGGDARGKWALTMHPSTGYEDFVEGIRPRQDTGDFELREGFLRAAIADAEKNPDSDFLILLDELNRANVARVLGDALLTLEPDKRRHHDGTAWVGGVVVTLPYSLSTFSMPDNLYVFATINTSDRSIAGLDSALRRRFAFVRVPPLNEADVLDELETEFGADAREALEASAHVLHRMNEDLLRPLLGADHLLGHSYLFTAARALEDERDEVTALAKELLDGTTKDGKSILRAFWVEVGAGTGEKRNQIDLSKAGSADPAAGSALYFFPTDTALPSGDTTRAVTIDWDGETYVGSELKYYGGRRPNRTWRINLKGISPSKRNLGDEGVARFARHVLVFLEVGPDHYAMRSLPLTAIPVLESWGTVDRSPLSTRRYGTLTAPTAPEARSSPAVRRTWQHSILPQLIDVVTTFSIEPVVTPDEATAFIESRAELTSEQRGAALGARDALEEHLTDLGLRLRVDGVGLARSIVVDLAEPAAIAPGDVSQPEAANSAPVT